MHDMNTYPCVELIRISHIISTVGESRCWVV